MNRDKIHDSSRRRIRLIGIVISALGIIAVALFLPQQLQKMATVGLVLGFAMFIFWVETSPGKKQPRSAGGIVTIADYFKRNRVLVMRAVGAPCIVWCVIVSFDDQLSTVQQEIAAVSGAVVIACLGGLLFRDRFRCPQCGTNFRKERVEKLGRWTMDTRSTEEIWNSCPNCNVSFQTPMAGTRLSG